MRIVAIGLGGAGSRIVDSLYSTDRRSSKVPCVQALAIDVDENALRELKGLPDCNKVFFPAMEPDLPGGAVAEPTATIDIAEIISRIHNFESGETDAILICMGLGGGMTDIAPHIITGIRSSITESIFGLVTLPCLAEGEKRSAKAADDLDILSPLLDGIIVFDNETWYKKTKALKATLQRKEKSLVHRLGLIRPEPELSPEHATYQILNEGIVRRISLILRAGEFKADGGIDLAEVVLDSGEVLNTMKGMGFITIGYAVERLPSNPLAFLSQFRPQSVFDEENKKKASRIVDLAKQAIYHEISTPCDMTSAHKALVLIAGPSHELSMKGFMTVRKWIDRSIAGLETRSGDYPVVNTKNVAIIIMLSGLENIPRISELREIRAQFQSWSERQRGGAGTQPSGAAGSLSAAATTGSLRDEMIVLPAKMKREPEQPLQKPDRMPVQQPLETELDEPLLSQKPVGDSIEKPPVPATDRIPEEKPADSPVPGTPPSPPLVRPDAPHPVSRHKVLVGKAETVAHPGAANPLQSTKTRVLPSAPQTPPAETLARPAVTKPVVSRISTTADKDAARVRIEQELQKQRLKAMAGKTRITDVPPAIPTEEIPLKTIKKRHESQSRVIVRETPPPQEDDTRHHEPVKKTVIIAKKKLVAHQVNEKTEEATDAAETEPQPQETTLVTPLQDSTLQGGEDLVEEEEVPIAIRDTSYRANDQVFEGRDMQRPRIAKVKDTSLLHTNLVPKKSSHQPMKRKPEPVEGSENEAGSDPDQKKSDRRGKKPDDLSWV